MEIIIRSRIFTFADKLSGFNIIPRIKRLNSHEKKSMTSRKVLQLQKLNKLITHANNSVPYYRTLFKELNVKPGKIESLGVLQNIPTLFKAQIQNNTDSFLSELFKDKKLFWGQTGGSTGYPLSYALDLNCRIQVRAAFYRAMTWAGWKVGDSVVSFWGRPIIKDINSTIYDKLKSFILNYNELDAHILDYKAIEKYVKILKRKSPKIIIGYASTLNLIADFIKENDVNFNNYSPYGIFSTAEMLQDKMRYNIEKAFKTKVFNSLINR